MSITLPRDAKSAVPDKAVRPPPPRAAAGSRETILLVEDEKSIRVTTQRVLERLGYTILAAESPAEALRLAADYGDTIHLMLSDVIMPDMDGPALATELLKDRPQMRCIFMSGFSANAIAGRGVLNAETNFLAKPFDRDQLVQKLRDVLDAEDRETGS
jgi:two-component system, cell cycle sensor histidine kinase and response regulator CckA